MADPDVIWLEPWCEKCDSMFPDDTGRTWAPDNPYDDCPDCGKPPTRYIRQEEEGR